LKGFLEQETEMCSGNGDVVVFVVVETIFRIGNGDVLKNCCEN
jgi:hypothetical protein